MDVSGELTAVSIRINKIVAVMTPRIFDSLKLQKHVEVSSQYL